MEKKLFVSVLISLSIMVLLNSCGGNIYSEAIKLNTQFVKLMETYLDDLNKSDSAKEVAKAINKYADGLEKIWPRMKAITDANPELKDKANLPEDVKESNKEAEAMGRKMASAFRKVMPHMRDPEVKKAQERLSKIMR